MTSKVFIFDAEFSGLTLSDAALEIAILEVKMDRDFYRPGRYFRRVLSFRFEPESSFAKQHHASLYDECKSAECVTPNVVRDSIIDFFNLCESHDPLFRTLIGSRLNSYKLEILDRSRYLNKPQTIDFESGPQYIADYGNVIDIDSLDGFFAETFNHLKEDVESALNQIEATMPLGHRHRALFDCYVYLKRINEYRLFFLSPWSKNAKIPGSNSKI